MQHADSDRSPLTADATVEGRIVAVLSRVLGRELVGVTAATRLFEDLAITSVSMLELLLGVEEELGVQFDPESLEPFETVGSFTDYVRAHLGSSAE
jgi:acyl carrier protein